MATSGATIRPATHDDIPQIRALLVSHGNDGPIVNGDVVGPYLRHLVDHGRTLVSVADGDLVGFAAAVDTGRGWHLADLFVKLDRLGQGIGRSLLEAVFDGADQRSTVASDDPRALPIYVRAGMLPLWPCLYMEGAATGLMDSGPPLSTEPATSVRIAGIERGWTGQDRPLDHEFWASELDADPFVVVDGREVVAVGYGRARQASPVRALDRLAIHPDVDPLPASLAGIVRAARDGMVLVCVLGPSPLVRTLLDAGFRIADRDTYMASRDDLIDPARLIPNPGMR